MPDRDYYLRDEPRFKNAREKYLAYAQHMLTLAGSSEREATAAVGGVMKIETALAQARLSRIELRDPQVVDHPMSFAALRKLSPAL